MLGGLRTTEFGLWFVLVLFIHALLVGSGRASDQPSSKTELTNVESKSVESEELSPKSGSSSESDPGEADADRPAELTPVDLRVRALAKPLKFHSKGFWKAVLVKFDRDFHITLSAVKKDDKLSGVAAHIVDHAHGDTVIKGVLDVTVNGALRSKRPELLSAANVGAIDPVLRQRLLRSSGPFKGKGQIEVQGEARIVDLVHRRIGEVADDDSMRIETTSTTLDGKSKLVTTVTLAPDGFPWLAETTGTIAKGPVNVEIYVKLTREGMGSKAP